MIPAAIWPPFDGLKTTWPTNPEPVALDIATAAVVQSPDVALIVIAVTCPGATGSLCSGGVWVKSASALVSTSWLPKLDPINPKIVPAGIGNAVALLPPVL